MVAPCFVASSRVAPFIAVTAAAPDETSFPFPRSVSGGIAGAAGFAAGGARVSLSASRLCSGISPRRTRVAMATASGEATGATRSGAAGFAVRSMWLPADGPRCAAYCHPVQTRAPAAIADSAKAALSAGRGPPSRTPVAASLSGAASAVTGTSYAMSPAREPQRFPAEPFRIERLSNRQIVQTRWSVQQRQNAALRERETAGGHSHLGIARRRPAKHLGRVHDGDLADEEEVVATAGAAGRGSRPLDGKASNTAQPLRLLQSQCHGRRLADRRNRPVAREAGSAEGVQESGRYRDGRWTNGKTDYFFASFAASFAAALAFIAASSAFAAASFDASAAWFAASFVAVPA